MLWHKGISLFSKSQSVTLWMNAVDNFVNNQLLILSQD